MMLRKNHIVNFFKRRKQESLDTALPALYYQYPIAIKKAKTEDLKKLVSEYVPPEFMHSDKDC